MNDNLNPACCTHHPDTVHCGHIFCLTCGPTRPTTDGQTSPDRAYPGSQA